MQFKLYEKLTSANYFQIQREKPYDYLLIIQTGKNSRRKIAGRCFLKPFFSHARKLFSEFPYKIFVTALHDIIGLQNFSLYFCQSLSRITMCNLHWCYTFCTGVTLFALVLHLNCTALSQYNNGNTIPLFNVVNALSYQLLYRHATKNK